MTVDTHGGTYAAQLAQADNKTADDAFLSACNALLLAMAYKSQLTIPEVETLLYSIPNDDYETYIGLMKSLNKFKLMPGFARK